MSDNDCRGKTCWCKCIPLRLSHDAAEEFQGLFERVKELERWPSLIKYLEKKIYELQEHHVRQRVPYKCPVCNGLGNPDISETTAYGPRRHMIENDPCNSCKGTGILWE